jgi:hypothetical protein
LFAQWLQAINKEPPRNVEVCDLIAGMFLCDPQGIASLADDAREFLGYLKSECHVGAPPWLYQYQFNVRSQETESHVLMPFAVAAREAIDRSESVALHRSERTVPVTATVGDLLEAILSIPGSVASHLARLGITVEKVRKLYL